MICDVNAARKAAGKPEIPFSVFVHGTALKMFHNELAGDNPAEFPMRFTPFVRTAVEGGSALAKATNCFIISEAERAKLLSVYDGLQTPVVLSPNGVNMNVFRPTGKTREEVLGSLQTFTYEGCGVSAALQHRACITHAPRMRRVCAAPWIEQRACLDRPNPAPHANRAAQSYTERARDARRAVYVCEVYGKVHRPIHSARVWSASGLRCRAARAPFRPPAHTVGGDTPADEWLHENDRVRGQVCRLEAARLSADGGGNL